MPPNPSPPVEARFQSRARWLHGVQGWLLALSATVLAASGQVEFATSADITDVRRFLVPAILEIAAVFVLLGGYLRACEGDSPAVMWGLAAGITAFAVWTNLEHGGPRAGRIYAAATLLTFVLWLLKLRDHYRAARRASGLVEPPTARFRLIRWLVMPLLTRRAWLISIEYNLRDADKALRCARMWRDTFTDTSAVSPGPSWTRRGAGRRAADLVVRSAAACTVAGHQAAPDGPVIAHVHSGLAVGRPAAARRHRVPAQGSNSNAATPPRRRSQTGGRGGLRSAGHGMRRHRRRIRRRFLLHGPALVNQAMAVEAGGGAAVRGQPPTRLPMTAQLGTTQAYDPINPHDAVMYAAWRAGVLAGREPSGADLARATGRPDDATGVGRRAARRYRRAQPAPSVPAMS